MIRVIRVSWRLGPGHLWTQSPHQSRDRCSCSGAKRKIQSSIRKNQCPGCVCVACLFQKRRPREKRQNLPSGCRYAMRGKIQKTSSPDFLFYLVRIQKYSQQRRRQDRFQGAFARPIWSGEHAQPRGRRAHLIVKTVPLTNCVGGSILFTSTRRPSGV